MPGRCGGFIPSPSMGEDQGEGEMGGKGLTHQPHQHAQGSNRDQRFKLLARLISNLRATAGAAGRVANNTVALAATQNAAIT